MAPVEVELHPEAQYEAEAAYRWYAHSAPAAEGFALELEQAIFSISETPTAWPVHLRETRRYLLRRYPFTVHRQKPKVVEVVAIAHARRRPGYWRSR